MEISTKIVPFNSVIAAKSGLKDIVFPEKEKILIIFLGDWSGSIECIRAEAQTLTFLAETHATTQVPEAKILYIPYDRDSETRPISRSEFYKLTPSGGTQASRAVKRVASALKMFRKENPGWKVYVFHYSDGFDFDPFSCAQELRRLLPEIEQYLYCEIYSSLFPSDNLSLYFGLLPVKKEFPDGKLLLVRIGHKDILSLAEKNPLILYVLSITKYRGIPPSLEDLENIKKLPPPDEMFEIETE